MGLYKNTNGTLTPIAGRGRAEYGASTVRTGTSTITTVASGASGVESVLFDDAMPDTDYVVVLSPSNTGERKVSVFANEKSTNGFNIIYSNMGSTALSNFTIQWYAFKLYTDMEYNNILDSIPDDAAASNQFATKNSLKWKKLGSVSAKYNSVSFSSVADIANEYLVVMNVGSGQAWEVSMTVPVDQIASGRYYYMGSGGTADGNDAVRACVQVSGQTFVYVDSYKGGNEHTDSTLVIYYR